MELMANASAADWDETVPASTDDLDMGCNEILFLRQGVQDRVEREHVAFAAGTVGGWHLAGSAKSYHGAYGVLNDTDLPTLRPDGVTALTTDDHGRLAFNTTNNLLLVYVGGSPAWVPVISLESSVSWLASTGKLTRVPIAGEVVKTTLVSSLHAGLAGAGIVTELAGVADADADEFATTNLASLIQSFSFTPAYATSILRIRGSIPGYWYGTSISIGILESTTILAACAFTRPYNNGMHTLNFDFQIPAVAATARTLLLKGSSRGSTGYYFDICHLTHATASSYAKVSLSIEEIKQ
jgi:hypothetical protein